MSTRVRLNTSTAVVAPPSNNEPVVIPGFDNLHKIAATACAFDLQAGDVKAKGNQTMAFAVYGTWMRWKEYGHPDLEEKALPDLRHVLGKAKDAIENKKELKKLLSAELLEQMDTEGLSFDDKAQIANRKIANGAMLARSIGYASVLLHCGVPLSAFNFTKGCYWWEVDGPLFYPEGVTAVGRAAVTVKTGKDGIVSVTTPRIAINNRGLLGQKTDGKEWRGNASIDQLERTYRARADLTPARSTDSKVALKDVTPATLADKVSLAKLVTALHKAFVRDDKAKAVKPNAIDAGIWRLLSDIAQENDAIQNSADFKAWRDAGVTDKAQVASADGKLIEQTPAAA